MKLQLDKIRKTMQTDAMRLKIYRTERHLLVLQANVRDQFAGRVVDEGAPAEQAETIVEADHNHLNKKMSKCNERMRNKFKKLDRHVNPTHKVAQGNRSRNHKDGCAAIL